MKKFALILFAVSAVGCSASKVKEDRSFAEKFNGQTYESSNSVVNVPVLNNEAPAQRKISGRVFCGEGLSQVPVHNALIRLKDGETVLATGSSDIKGQYTVLAKLKKAKLYQIEADAKCGKSEMTLSWQGESVVENPDLILRTLK